VSLPLEDATSSISAAGIVFITAAATGEVGAARVSEQYSATPSPEGDDIMHIMTQALVDCFIAIFDYMVVYMVCISSFKVLFIA